MALRAIIILALFLPFGIIFYQEVSGEGRGPGFGLNANLLAWVIGLTCLLTIVYGVAIRYVRNLHRFAMLQMGLDILLETGVIYYTGAVTTPFMVLYLLSIIGAAALLDRRGALTITSFAVLCYLTLLNSLYWGVVPLKSWIYEDVAAIPLREILYHIFVSLTGFMATAILVNTLAERGRRTRVELRQVGSELNELQEFHQRIVDNVSAGILVIRQDGTIGFLNPPATLISGYGAEELRGKPLSILTPDADEILSEAVDALCESSVFRVDATILTRSGERKPIGASVTSFPPVSDDPHHLGSLVMIFQDLSELRKLEAQILKKEKLAAVGEVAAGIAHEIRNPLASMSGSIQLLRDELYLSGDQRRLMEIVISESSRLSGIIKDFLVYARPPTPNMRPVILIELLEETLALLRNSPELRESHRIEVVSEDCSLVVQADVGQIKQVFWNLCLNALEAMPEGGTLSVALRSSLTGEAIVVFKDTGTGMDDERKAHLFTPFSSGSSRRTGLGLAIVHRILREHGGTIDVSSEKGAGTTVTIRMPLEKAQVHA